MRRGEIEIESGRERKPKYRQIKDSCIEDEKIYTNNFRSVLMFRCRTNTVKLNWRNQFEGDLYSVRCVGIKERKH